MPDQITSWWWVRHGPTHADGLVGHLDIPADLGNQSEINWLVDHLPQTAHLVSSDLIRSIETADIIGKNKLRLAHSPHLREMDYGDWDGKTFEEISVSHPDLSKEFWSNPGTSTPPNGENWDRFSKRVSKEIQMLNKSVPSENIIAVAHYGVILAALQLATGQTNSSVFSFKINNLSISRFDYIHKLDTWRVHSVNETS